MAVIGSLSVKLGLVTVDWDKATDQAKKQAKDLQNSFNNIGKELSGVTNLFKSLGGVVGLTTIGFGALSASAMSFSNDVKDVSDGFDISVQKVLQFRNAIEISGGSAEGASKILTKLFTTLNSAKEGSPVAIKQFEDLGITWQELNKLKPEDAINRVFDALANGSEDSFKRIAALKDFAGKAGVGLDVKGISEELKKGTQKFDEHAAAIKRVGDASDALKTTADNLKIAMTDLMAPFVSKDNVISIDLFKAALLGIGGIAIVSGVRTLAGAVMFLNTALVGLSVTGGAISLTMTPMLATLAAWGTRVAAIATGIVGSTVALGAFLALHPSSLADDHPNDALILAGRNKPKPDGSNAPTEVADTPAVKALKSKVEMTQKLMELESKSADVKARSYTLDEYSTSNAEIGLALEKEKVTAKDTLVQYLGTEKRTQEEIAGANAVYAASIAATNSKAADSRKVLMKQEERELQILNLKSKLQKDLAKIDLQAIELGHQKQFISDYDYNLANEQLNSQKKIMSIKEQISELNKGSDDAGRKHYAALKKSLEEEITAEENASQKRISNMTADETRRQDLLQRQINLKQELAKLDLDSLDLAHQKNWMSDYDYNVAVERLDTEKKLKTLQEQLAEIPKGDDPKSIAHYNELSKTIQDEIDIETAASNKRLQLFAEDAANRESFVYGWEQAWFQYQKSASDASAKGSEAFSTLMGDMTSALNTFVDTGKISFSSLISSMIKDLIKLAMQAQMNSMFSTLFSGGGGLGGLLGSAPIGSAGTGDGLLGWLSTTFSPHAAGGNFGANSPMLVGERGPELMIPNKSGAIIPNNALAGAMGSGAQTVYNGTVIQNMNAIDTQSGVQFLTKNKDAIWAANQSAQRSLPMSR